MASLNPVASSVEASAVSTNAIVAAGYLNKEKSSDLAQLFGQFNRRYFVLTPSVLVYFLDERAFRRNEAAGILKVSRMLDAKLVLEVPGEIFEIVTATHSIRLQANNAVDRTRWIQALRKLIGESQASPPVKIQDNTNELLRMNMFGYLEKENNVSGLLNGHWNRRYFTFDGEYLKYAHDAEMFLGPSLCVHIRDIAGVSPDLKPPGDVFQIFTSKRAFRLRAVSEHERNRWTEAVQKALDRRESVTEKQQENDLITAKEELARLTISSTDLLDNNTIDGEYKDDLRQSSSEPVSNTAEEPGNTPSIKKPRPSAGTGTS